MMEAVFLWKGEDGNENTLTKIFPKLKKLELVNLPNLISLCQGIEGIEFPLLKSIWIQECKKMKGMTANGVTNNENNSGGTHHILCESQVSFGCLKILDTDRNPFCSHTIHVSIFNGLEKLYCSTCAGSRSFFTSSMAGNLVNLRVLIISNCDEMVEVIKDDEEKGMSGGRQTALLFPKLHTLKLENLPNLLSFCESKGIESIQFPKLHTLKLEDLPKLVSFCESKGIESIQFPKLQELELRDLPKLVSFCESKGIESIQFPVLRRMEITRCGKMKGMVANASDTIRLFCESQVSFGCLKKLDTDRNPFCSHTIHVSLLNGLEELKISNYAGSRSLFTSSMAGNLVNLKELCIEWCDEMVEVIKDDEEKGMSGGRQTALLFPKLQKLELSGLPKLVRFCESKGIESIQFPVLRSMHIESCGKMKGMVANGVTSNENNSGGSSTNAADTLFCESQQVSFGCLKKLDTDRNSFSELEELKIIGCQSILSLFTSSMAGNLVNLKVLTIGYCDEMVEVIKDDEEKGMSGGCQRALLFPKLQELELRDLPKLVRFCESKGIESIQFPVLRIMEIIECGQKKGMVANGVTSNENNSAGSSTNAAGIFHPFCQSKHVSFSDLEELSIFRCQSIVSLFTSSMAGNLVNLKELRIEDCVKMVEVIKDDEEKGMSGGRQTAPLLFPKLHEIYLLGLSKLVSFCELKCDVEFPSLRKVTTYNCPNMKIFTLGSLAAPNLESFTTDLNNYLQVPFNTVKELWIKRNEKPLNCYQIHGSVFDRLEVLTIDGYKGSMRLFSSSITGNLVNLTTLTIEDCFKMVKVIEEKEEEKEKVVSGAQRTTILFPKLHKIVLWRLFELVRFCEWKCDVELPSLTKVEIFLCNKMKSFTLEPLNTPKLESVKIHGKRVGGVKDLNGLVQQQYINQTEEKQAEEAEKKKAYLNFQET